MTTGAPGGRGAHRVRPRWACGRIVRDDPVPWGLFRIDGDPWRTWSAVIGRWEFYVARRVPPEKRRFR